jgi:hypothetical protein
MPVTDEASESSTGGTMLPEQWEHMHVSEADDPFEALDTQLDCLGLGGLFIGQYELDGPFARRRDGSLRLCAPAAHALP